MKSGTHPEYKKVAVKCSCGNNFETRSTLGQDQLHVEVCSNCHPFYTGKQKIVDTAGRVEDFNRRFGGSLGVGSKSAPKATAAVTAINTTSKVEVKEAAKSTDAVKTKSASAAKPAANKTDKAKK